VLSGHDADAHQLDRFLGQAAVSEELCHGDHLAANDVQLLHPRTLTGADVDIKAPLCLLSAMTTLLD
jgi:hypothetical protein